MIKRESQKSNGLSKTGCFKIARVSSSGYYSWLQRKEDKNGKRAKEVAKNNEIKEKMREIIRKLGYVPGKRTYKVHLYRDFNISVSIKKCKKLMKSMHLIASMPKKDAYKGQAKHFHEACALQNYVQQDLKLDQDE